MNNKTIRKIQINNKIKKEFKSKNNIYVIMLFILTGLFFMLSIGYAALLSSVEIRGTISAYSLGEMFVSNVLVDDNNGVVQNNIPSFSNCSLNTDLNFSGNNYSFINYEVTISNATSDYQRFAGVQYNATQTVKDTIKYELSNELKEGDRLAPGDSVTFTVTLSYVGEAKEGQYILGLDFLFENDGVIYATVNTTTGDLTGSNTQAPFVVTVYNSSEQAISFLLQGDNNSKINLTDQNGNALSTLSIGPKTNQNYTIYARKVDGARYQADLEITTLSIIYNSVTSVVDNLHLSVDINYIPDNIIPSISNVTVSRNPTEGSINVTWNRTDIGGTPITNYGIKLYDSSNNLITTANTNNATTSYTFTGQNEGTYYALVYGEDEAGNTGSSYCNAGSTSEHCSKSPNAQMKWRYTVTHSLSNMTSISNATVLLGSTYNVTLRASSNYKLPDDITVTMAGRTLTAGTDYTYNNSSGAVSIGNITGDVTITASASRSCLVEGTLIKLADGTTKKVEDIDYNDLLLVWNYETGSFTYEYPIWIEKTDTIDNYQKTTFSDKSILKTVGFHGVFSKDKNMFISVDDYDNFKKGENIVKFDNNKISTVSVEKIENVKEKVNYYHIVSTRYYNVIANDFLTTDGTVILSNLYGFTDNIMWPSIRKTIVNNSNNLYSYNDLKDVIPYYMYKGLRAAEGKVIEQYISKDMFKYYLLNNQNNKKMLKEPIKDSNNNNLWMVTTSDDIVIEKDNYLHKEGSYYVLKHPKNRNNFKSWYNTSDGNYYKPGDIVQIWYGTHFEAVYY